MQRQINQEALDEQSCVAAAAVAHSLVLLLRLHDDKVPFVVDFLVQIAVVFLQRKKEEKDHK